MDDDDMAHPERFATQLQYLKEHPDIALCGTRIRFVDQDGKTNNVGEGNQRYETWLNGLTTPKAISDGCFIECTSCLARRHTDGKA